MDIPAWLQERINTDCPHCGQPIVNNEQLTDRFCSNPKCPEHMAQKIDALAKRFGIKNFGVAAARDAIRYYHLDYHTQIIPHWFQEKPVLYLHEVGELCLVKGHQKKWRGYCEGKRNMLEVLRDPTLPLAVRKQAGLLLVTAALCEVKPNLEGARINVMLSGSFDAYRARADFVSDMNRKYGDVVQLVDVGKRKTGVDFLVKEAHTTDHEKSAIAEAYGITVITPSHLAAKLEAYRTYKMERRRAE